MRKQTKIKAAKKILKIAYRYGRFREKLSSGFRAKKKQNNLTTAFSAGFGGGLGASLGSKPKKRRSKKK